MTALPNMKKCGLTKFCRDSHSHSVSSPPLQPINNIHHRSPRAFLMKETATGVVVVTDVTYRAFKALLQYFYPNYTTL